MPNDILTLTAKQLERFERELDRIQNRRVRNYEKELERVLKREGGRLIRDQINVLRQELGKQGALDGTGGAFVDAALTAGTTLANGGKLSNRTIASTVAGIFLTSSGILNLSRAQKARRAQQTMGKGGRIS